MAKKTKSNLSAGKNKQRVRKLTRKDEKQVILTAKKLPGSFKILGQAFQHIWRNKRLFAIILLIFSVFYIVLVKGLANNFELGETNAAINETVGNQIGTPEKALTLFSTLLGTTGSTTGEAASVYQTLLFVIISLVIIWSLRQTFDGKTQVKVKDAFYKSMSPFITYILVGLVIIIQAVPALIGVTLYGSVASAGIAVGALEQIVWFVVMIGGVALSSYLISSSLFASYIVTLPGTTPLVALRSARKLVRFKRLSVIRKFLFLPAFVLVCFAIIFLPLVLLLPVVAEVLFFVMSISLILVGHTYFYVLYRELL